MWMGEFTTLVKENIELKTKLAILEAKLAEIENKTKKRAKSNKPSWMITPDFVGYATATLLVALRDNNGYNIYHELLSLKNVPGGMIITEVDREKAVKIYCRLNNLVVDGSRFVILDDLLYNLLFNDFKIQESIGNITNADGNILYVIEVGKSNGYVKQIACALRRLDTL